MDPLWPEEGCQAVLWSSWEDEAVLCSLPSPQQDPGSPGTALAQPVGAGSAARRYQGTALPGPALPCPGAAAALSS